MKTLRLIFFSALSLQLSVFLGRSLSVWHKLMLQYLPPLFCKMSPNLMDCKGISCVPPSSDQPTYVRWNSALNSGWAIPQPSFYTGEAILLNVCFGSLSCWKMKRNFIFLCLTEGWGFVSSVTGIWRCSSFHPPWLKPHFRLKKNSPKAWCFSEGMWSFLWWALLIRGHV